MTSALNSVSRTIGNGFNAVADAASEYVVYPALRLHYSNDELAERQGSNNDFFHGLADRGDEVSEFYDQGRILRGITHANSGLAGETIKEGGRHVKEMFYDLFKGRHWNNIAVGSLGAVTGALAGNMIPKIGFCARVFETTCRRYHRWWRWVGYGGYNHEKSEL